MKDTDRGSAYPAYVWDLAVAYRIAHEYETYALSIGCYVKDGHELVAPTKHQAELLAAKWKILTAL